MKKIILYSITIVTLLVLITGTAFAQDSYSESDCFVENCSTENFSEKSFNNSQPTTKLDSSSEKSEDTNELDTGEEYRFIRAEDLDYDYEYDSLFANAKNVEDISASDSKAVCFKNVSINEESYSRDKLQGINVSDDALKVFSLLEIRAKKDGINTENIRIPYIDDDLRSIDGYWIFASNPEMKENYVKILEESHSKSSNDLILFVKTFNKKYPTKYVNTGIVTFITIENKNELFLELTNEDRIMLGKASYAILNELSRKRNENITPKWGSDNPDVHGYMSEKAALNAGFTAEQAAIIKNNSGEPDYFYPTGDCYHTNYQHYYNPRDFNDNGFGGAPERVNHYYSEIGLAETTEEKLVKLAYASHYMDDLSMPLHTSHAV